jgi:hypothetical protein
MLLERILILLLFGAVSIFFIGIPLFRLVQKLIPEKRDPVKEARQRLEQARLEAEAARLNKETEKLYENLYHDVLDDDTETENRRKL